MKMDLQKLMNRADEISRAICEWDERKWKSKPRGKGAMTTLRKEVVSALVETSAVCDALRDAGFIVCGSNYFGDATLFSDWDFFRQDSPATREFLTSIGFTEEHLTYSDANTVTVFEWHSEHCWRKGFSSVHAILVASEVKRQKAQRILEGVPKDVRKKTACWDGVYAALEAGGGGAELGANVETGESKSGAGSHSDRIQRPPATGVQKADTASPGGSLQ